MTPRKAVPSVGLAAALAAEAEKINGPKICLLQQQINGLSPDDREAAERVLADMKIPTQRLIAIFRDHGMTAGRQLYYTHRAGMCVCSKGSA